MFDLNMLKETNQSMVMEKEKKDTLVFHRSNLFQPNLFGVTKLVSYLDTFSIAVVREPNKLREANHHVCYLEIYRPSFCGVPILSTSFIVYEHIKDIVWLNFNLILTVSSEQTISIYSVKCTERIYSLIADYGSITCLKYLHNERLLIIGTEYGYVAAYKISIEEKKAEFINKMVKINSKISTIEVATRTRAKHKSKSVTPLEVKSSTIKKSGKRKQPDSSEDENEDEVMDENDNDDSLDKIDITIYGASLSDVVVWNYHSKTIVDTMRVCDKSEEAVLSLLVLNNGDILVGDSTGTLSLFDHNSLTCRQTIKTTNFAIRCIAKNRDGSHILVSGADPTIVILKKGAVDKAGLVLYEKTQSHTHEVTAIIFKDKREFFTGALDGLIIRHKLHKEKGVRKEMRRDVIYPNYHNHISFFQNEMLLQQDRTLVLFKLPDTDVQTHSDLQMLIDHQPHPIKHLLLKTRDFVHLSTFSDKWIAYTTMKGLHIFSRKGTKLEQGRLNKKMLDCSMLKICNNRHLVCAAGAHMYGIDLEEFEESNHNGNKSIIYKIKSELNLNSPIDQITYVQSKNQIFVSCRHIILAYQLQCDAKKIFKKALSVNISGDEVSLLGHHEDLTVSGKMLVFTSKGRLITFDLDAKTKLITMTNENKPIADLPDTPIIGMLPLSKDLCLLYNEDHLFKVDLVSNKVVNTNTDYKNIIRMDFLFEKLNQVALAELTPDDYMKLLPPRVQLKKFGCF